MNTIYKETNFFFRKRKKDIFKEVQAFDEELPFSLPLDYKLFLSFFEVTPILLEFDHELGVSPNNPDGKSLGFFKAEEGFTHIFMSLTEFNLIETILNDKYINKNYFSIGSPYFPNGIILIALKGDMYGKIYHSTYDWLGDEYFNEEPNYDEWNLLADNFGDYISSLEILNTKYMGYSGIIV